MLSLKWYFLSCHGCYYCIHEPACEGERGLYFGIGPAFPPRMPFIPSPNSFGRKSGQVSRFRGSVKWGFPQHKKPNSWTEYHKVFSAGGSVPNCVLRNVERIIINLQTSIDSKINLTSQTIFPLLSSSQGTFWGFTFPQSLTASKIKSNQY
jgi:hypothetical protein